MSGSSDRLASMLRLRAGLGINYGLSPNGGNSDYNWLIGLLNGDEPSILTGGSPVYRFAAPIRLTTFDGVNDLSAAITDPLTGRTSPNLLVRGKHGKHAEFEHSASGKILYIYDDGLHLGDVPIYAGSLGLIELLGDVGVDGDLGVTEDLFVGGDAVFDGDIECDNLEVNGDASVDGFMTVNEDLAVDGNLDVDGDSDLQFVNLTPDPGEEPQLMFRYDQTRLYWGMGASDSATPNFHLFSFDGSLVPTEQFEITETGRVNVHSMEIYGGGASGFGRLYCSDDAATSEFDCAVDFNAFCSFGGLLTTGDTAIQLTNNAVINFDYGSVGGFSRSSWDGTIRAKFEGDEVRIPFYYV